MLCCLSYQETTLGVIVHESHEGVKTWELIQAELKYYSLLIEVHQELQFQVNQVNIILIRE